MYISLALIPIHDVRVTKTLAVHHATRRTDYYYQPELYTCSGSVKITNEIYASRAQNVLDSIISDPLKRAMQSMCTLCGFTMTCVPLLLDSIDIEVCRS